MKVKEESEKIVLKLDIQKTKIMASCPITSQQIYGETVETVRDFIMGGSKTLQMVTVAVKLKDAEHFLALPFFGIGMETYLFQSCGHC